MIKLNGKRVLITGGAMGIGRETVELLLKEGCNIIVWDNNLKAINRASAELEPFCEQLSWTCLDISNRELVTKKAKELLDNHPIDILINNAGILRRGSFLEGSLDDWDLTVAVNLNSIIYTIKSFLPSMYEQDTGHIINVSSAAGLLGVSGLSVYAATKWAVVGLTDSLREEAQSAKKSIFFTSVHPFYIASGLFEGARIKGLGSLLVPQVKNHGVIAKAIVKALKYKKKRVYRPRSLWLVDFLRGVLPFGLFVRVLRWLKVQKSMNYHVENTPKGKSK